MLIDTAVVHECFLERVARASCCLLICGCSDDKVNERRSALISETVGSIKSPSTRGHVASLYGPDASGGLRQVFTPAHAA